MEKPSLSAWNTSHRFYAVIPSPTSRSYADQVPNTAADYPVVTVEHLPEHLGFLDFLVDRSIDAWTRSQG